MTKEKSFVVEGVLMALSIASIVGAIYIYYKTGDLIESLLSFAIGTNFFLINMIYIAKRQIQRLKQELVECWRKATEEK